MSNLKLHYLKATHNEKRTMVVEQRIMSNLKLHYLKATHNEPMEVAMKCFIMSNLKLHYRVACPIESNSQLKDDKSTRKLIMSNPKLHIYLQLNSTLVRLLSLLNLCQSSTFRHNLTKRIHFEELSESEKTKSANIAWYRATF